MKKLYIVKYRQTGASYITTVRPWLPKSGTLWMMEEVEVQEAILTGRTWTYNTRTKRLEVQQRATPIRNIKPKAPAASHKPKSKPKPKPQAQAQAAAKEKE